VNQKGKKISLSKFFSLPAIVIIILIFDIAIISVILANYQYSAESRKRDYMNGHWLVSQQKSSTIEDYFYSISLYLRHLNSLPVIQYMDNSHAIERLNQNFANLEKDGLVTIYRFDVNGRVQLSFDAGGAHYGDSGAELKNLFEWIKEPSNKDRIKISFSEGSVIGRTEKTMALISMPTYQSSTNPFHSVATGNFAGGVVLAVNMEKILRKLSFFPESYADTAIGIRGKTGNLDLVRNISFSVKRFTPGSYYENDRFISLTPLNLSDEYNFLIIETDNKRFLESIEVLKELNYSLAGLSMLISLFVLFVVILEKRRRERALKELELTEKFHHLFNNANDAIIVVDLASLRIVDVNQKACDFLGYAREEFLKLNQWDMHPPELSVKYQKIFKEHCASGQTTEPQKIEMLSKDGKIVHAEVSSKVFNFGGKTLIQGIFRDLAERKKAEQILLNQQKMESLNTMAGGIAHDFNNILTGILGFLFLLKKDKSNIDEKIDDIELLVKRASVIIRHLMSFSKKSIIVNRPLDLNALIRDSFALLRSVVPEDIFIDLELSSERLVVESDPSQIHQVLMNLVLNAKEAMIGGGNITVRTCSMVQAGLDCAGIIVSDTGCGMDEEVRKKAFEPFFTTKSQGSGLGLSSVYGIVRNLNGQISIDSIVGKGTTISIFIPLSEKEPQFTEPRNPEIVRGQGTILIVEDNPAVLELCSGVLKESGYNVISAQNGEEAANLFRERGDGIDLILMDVVMPKSGGIKTLEQLRGLKGDQKFILMSGYTKNEDIESLLIENRVEFIQKPFTPAELSRKIKQMLMEKI